MYIPDGCAEYELVIKKSRFIARAGGVSSPEEAKTEVKRLKILHPEATHVVHACLCGAGGDIFSFSDDREPPGTAGRPVLEILKGSGITDILVTVIRWFGGTKLGTGGLVKAYGDAAKGVLERLPVREMETRTGFSLQVPYRFYEPAARWTEVCGGIITATDFFEDVLLRGFLGVETKERWEQHIRDLTGGGAVILWAEDS
ncbi:MAG: YigZ family protein [Spirochaetales bacterium]|nr:YigZ family protein [Spirochaetales bacterium]